MREINLLLVILIAFVLIGCSPSSYETSKYSGETPFISESPKDDTLTPQKTDIIASQVKNWLKVSIISIKENTNTIDINFKLENVGEESVKNVLAPNGPDTVSVLFNYEKNETGYDSEFVDSNTGFCENFPYIEKPNCNPLYVFANIHKSTQEFDRFIITYIPHMWFNYAENSIFYIKKENDVFVPISKEDFYGIKLKKDNDIPSITYSDMLKLKPDTDIRVCTQNFFGDELTTCLTVLARGNKNPEICEYATSKLMELECKRRILHSFSDELNILQNTGIDVLSLCEELPADNNEIGQYGKTCFEVIKQAGIS